MNYSGEFTDIKSFHAQADAVIAQIQHHTENVRKGQIKCTVGRCKHCEVLSDYFKRHEARSRQFYVPVEQVVQVVIGLLVRWKCPGCDRTFTDYPEFAVPYKRYTLPMIKAYCRHYVENVEISYRALINEMPVQYPDSQKESSHSTIHRWISTIGDYTGIIRKAHDLILQKSPESAVCRESAKLSVHPKKYRSQLRKQILIQCRRLIVL